jgi:hypothetical protein
MTSPPRKKRKCDELDHDRVEEEVKAQEALGAEESQNPLSAGVQGEDAQVDVGEGPSPEEEEDDDDGVPHGWRSTPKMGALVAPFLPFKVKCDTTAVKVQWQVGVQTCTRPPAADISGSSSPRPSVLNLGPCSCSDLLAMQTLLHPQPYPQPRTLVPACRSRWASSLMIVLSQRTASPWHMPSIELKSAWRRCRAQQSWASTYLWS